MTVCDAKIEVRTLDQDYEKKIDQNLQQCKGWWQKCLDEFSQIDQAENRYICLERYGFHKTAKYCTESLYANNEIFFYKRKNMYECLSSSENEFKNPELPDEVLNCLNKYYDYPVEQCL